MEGPSPDLHHHESDIELIAPENSTKLSTAESKASTDVSYNKEEDADYVEVTMDIQGDSVALHSVKTISESDMGEGDHEKLSLTGKRLEKKKSFGASVVQNATIRIKQLRRLATFSKPEAKRLERTKSAVAHALTGLKFISLTDVGAGWCKVEKEFEKLTATTDGYLPRALFSKCIGMPVLLYCFK
jgi:respiratory burst oxidase